ncbi:MAG TPA: tetratricopeptide repeat protein, partial [Gemmatimonadales bacterium]|nr:tetratricopeptide repeat protein [Gemmatimonadales bacterium]
GGGAAVASPTAPRDDLSKSGKRKSSSLVFLDVDAPPAPKGAGSRVAPPPKPVRPPAPAPEPEPVAESLIEPVTAEPDTSLEIESTSLVEGIEPTNAGGTLEGFETTSTEFGDVRLEAGEVPSLRDEVTAGDDIAPLAELEPTIPDDAGSMDAELDLEPLTDTELEIAPPAPPSPPPAAPAKAGPARTPFTPRRPGVGTPRGGMATTPSPKVKPVVPKRPAAPASPSARKAVVEVPPLELEPDFDTGTTDESHEVDDAPLAMESDTARPPGRRRSAAIDLGLDGTVRPAEDAGSLVFANIEQPVAPPTIDELEARVADDPDDPDAHQALGEALIEAGERERGIEELDLATTGFENRGNLVQAQDLVDEILRLDPNSVRHRQKQVEFAFKSGDKVRLIEAYLELADTLLRSDLPEKARAVYQRVAEHDPGNERAMAALSMLAPVAPVAPPAKPKSKTPAREEKTPARDAKMRVRDEVVEEGDFVDLGAMILSGDLPERDTRMKVADEEPTGDEERDFQEMLARFKQGIDENIDEGDFQSHYDLGVAFKEMGLLDEAIAELQKALRAPEGKLRSSEALGVCFIEKGAHVVAESILRRALELPASGDQDRLGILYWLARALEEQGKRVEARELYGRVFAVDIRFRDVGERAKALAKAK